jgi:hypothetical protein
MKTAKLGAIFLASVIALAGAGAAYAWWVDELTVNGNVTLGTFGWELTLEDIYVHDDYKNIVVEFAEIYDSDQGGHDDTIYFSADYMYPCVTLELEWDMHFWGSVPGHIDSIPYDITIEDVSTQGVIPDYMDLYCVVWLSTVFDYQGNLLPIPIEEEMSICEFFGWLLQSQWHECQWLEVSFFLHFVEEGMNYHDGTPVPAGVEPPMLTDFGFSITYNGVQYNAP